MYVNDIHVLAIHAKCATKPLVKCIVTNVVLVIKFLVRGAKQPIVPNVKGQFVKNIIIIVKERNVGIVPIGKIVIIVEHPCAKLVPS